MTATIEQRLAYPQIEAARLMGISVRTLRRWTVRKLIAGRRVDDGVVLYTHDEIQRMLTGKERPQ